MKEVIDVIFDRALTLLENNRTLLEQFAAELLERETLEDVELKRIAAEVARPTEAA